MNGRYHAGFGILVTIVMCIALGILVPGARIGFIITAVMFGATCCDLDILILGLGKHRNRVFHSAILPFGLFLNCLLFGGLWFSAAFAAGVFIHLLLDIKIGVSLAVAKSTLRGWIIVNCLACIPLMLWW